MRTLHDPNSIARLRTVLANAGDAHDDVLALLVFASAPADDLRAAEVAVLAAFLTRIGATDTTSAADLAGKIAAYFDAHPLPPSLASEVHAALRELVAAGVVDAAVLGAAMSVIPVGHGAKPAGSTRMGVMGRFALQAGVAR